MATAQYNYQDAKTQTRPPGDVESFKMIYGRQPSQYEAEHNLGLAGLGRFTGQPEFEPRFAKYGKMPITSTADRKFKYVEEEFQTGKPAATRLAIARAKLKASMLVNKYGSIALQCGVKVWAEDDDDKVIHTEQHAVHIALDADGNAQEGQVIEGRFLPNIYGEEVLTPSPTININQTAELIAVYAPSGTDETSDKDNSAFEDYRMSENYDILQFVVYDPAKVKVSTHKTHPMETSSKFQDRKVSDDSVEGMSPQSNKYVKEMREGEVEKPVTKTASTAATLHLPPSVNSSASSRKRLGDLHEEPSLTIIFPKSANPIKRDLKDLGRIEDTAEQSSMAVETQLNASCCKHTLFGFKTPKVDIATRSSGNSIASTKLSKISVTAKEESKAPNALAPSRGPHAAPKTCDSSTRREHSGLASRKRAQDSKPIYDQNGYRAQAASCIESIVSTAVDQKSEPRSKRPKLDTLSTKSHIRRGSNTKAASSQPLSCLIALKTTKTERDAPKVEADKLRKADEHQPKTQGQKALTIATTQPRPDSTTVERTRARAAQIEAVKVAANAKKKSAKPRVGRGAREEIQRYVPRALRQKNWSVS